MKRYTYYIICSLLMLSGAAVSTSCDDYLDVNPDNRTQIDTEDKVTKLLVSAYSVSLPILVHEQMSDNVTDRGTSYSWDNLNCRDAYLFTELFNDTEQDSPYELWESNYAAIAAANQALEAIEEMGGGSELSAQRGEALICRAYAHFTLCNIFCQAYNPQSSDTDLGIPYVYDIETDAFNHYERGTVADVYSKIAADIEEGLPLIDDNLYTQPKYHFNKAAANAFAAEFYLYYGDYERAVECATAAIGDNPLSRMRDFSSYDSYTGSAEITNAWVDSSLACNLFLQGITSWAGRMGYQSRAAHTRALVNETLGSFGPWGNTTLVYNNYMRYYTAGSIPSYFFPKQNEFFVYTDQVQGIGIGHIMNVRFSVERTLLNRAEAYTMLGMYDQAATDLSDFYIASGGTSSQLSASAISSWYETANDIYKRTLAPRFTVNAGMQENLIQACLHARRILTLHEGTRLMDLKRYGIAYTHEVQDGVNIEIQPYDPRLALQIPNMAIEAGLEANPR